MIVKKGCLKKCLLVYIGGIWNLSFWPLLTCPLLGVQIKFEAIILVLKATYRPFENY